MTLMVTHTLNGMWEPCNCQWLMVLPTLYGMWEPLTLNDLWSPIPYMECGNLVTVNDLLSPIPYTECGNLVTLNDSHGLPHLIWNRYLMVPHMYDLMVPLPYMEQVLYGPPHVQYEFFWAALKEVHYVS